MLRRPRGPSGPPAFERVGMDTDRESPRVAADPDRFKRFPTRKMRRGIPCAYLAMGPPLRTVSARRPQPGRLHDSDSQTPFDAENGPPGPKAPSRGRPRLRPGSEGRERVRHPNLVSFGAGFRIAIGRAPPEAAQGHPVISSGRGVAVRPAPRPARVVAARAERRGSGPPTRELRLRAARPRRARPYMPSSITPSRLGASPAGARQAPAGALPFRSHPPDQRERRGATGAPRRCGSDRALGLTVQSGEGASPSAPVGTPRIPHPHTDRASFRAFDAERGIEFRPVARAGVTPQARDDP